MNAQLTYPASQTPNQTQVLRLAGQLHDDWRRSRKLSSGEFEPRVKTTKDANWIRSNKTDQVDIANTAYADLPTDWQAENQASAEVAVSLVQQTLEQGVAFTHDLIEAASAVIHVEWLNRNGDYAPAEQKVPYSKLSEEEKEKDRLMFRAAMKICGAS